MFKFLISVFRSRIDCKNVLLSLFLTTDQLNSKNVSSDWVNPGSSEAKSNLYGNNNLRRKIIENTDYNEMQTASDDTLITSIKIRIHLYYNVRRYTFSVIRKCESV